MIRLRPVWDRTARHRGRDLARHLPFEDEHGSQRAPHRRSNGSSTAATARARIEAYQVAIRSAAQRLPGIEALPPEMRDALIFGATHLFDREAQLHQVYPQADEEDLRLAILQRFVATMKP